VVKLNPSGLHLWSQRFGDFEEQRGIRVATDSADNVVVTGHIRGTTGFGFPALTSAGNQDVFAVKLSPSGVHVWSKLFGDAADQLAWDVVIDSADNILLSGVFAGTVNFGGAALTSAGVEDYFVAELAPNGAHLWSQRFGDVADQTYFAAAVDGADNIVLAGSLQGIVSFGGNALMDAGAGDVFVTKLAPSGAHVWSKRFGDAGAQMAWDVATDSRGNIALVGEFEGTIDFGGGPLVSAGGSDLFVAKLTP
jgi:hypothetical protein